MCYNISGVSMRLTIKVPGSCGELVQGMLKGEPFLITCPINIFTTVTISDEFSGKFGLGWKAETMLKKTLTYLGYDNDFNFGIALESKLPLGKGMASSSADIAAVAKAVALSLGTDITAEDIAALATTVEPTDGVFYNGIVAMNPVTGYIFRNFEPLSEYKIIIFDFGGEIDTLGFKRQSNFHLTELPQHIDISMATTSSLANQSILYKPQLEDIIHFAKSLGALAVTTAHTGTVIGVIFAEDTSQLYLEQCSTTITQKFTDINYIAAVKLISGGFRINDD